MLPTWLFGGGAGSCRPVSRVAGAAAKAKGCDALVVQIEHEQQVDLQRRVTAVPNLDLFLLQDAKQGEVRCIRIEREGLEAVLAPHASRRLTAVREGRQRFWEVQVEPLFLYHSFTLLEADGGEVLICLERHGERLEVMVGEGRLMDLYTLSYRSTGDKRHGASILERRDLGPRVGTPELFVGDLLAWLAGTLARTWQPYCFFTVNAQHFAHQLEEFLEGRAEEPPPPPEPSGGEGAAPPAEMCCPAARAASRPDWMLADPSGLTDRKAVLAAVRASGESLGLAIEEFRSDPEIVMAAVAQDGRALRFAAERLRQERELVLAAVRQDATAHEFASESLRRDSEVLLAALRHQGDPSGAAPLFPRGVRAYGSHASPTPAVAASRSWPSTAIADHLQNSQWQVRQAACQALCRQGLEALHPHLKAVAQRLSDEEWPVREAACQALRQAGGAAEPYAASLATHLKDPEWLVRLAACKALGQLGPGAAQFTVALASCLADGSPQVRVASRKVLERLGQAAVPALVESLGAENAGTRQAACQALGRLGGDTAAPAAGALAACLADERWQVRLAACEAFGLLGEASASPHVCALVGCLGDEDGDVRGAALQALSQLGGGVLGPFASYVAGHLNDERWPVRSAACKTLGMMGGDAEPYTGMLAHLAKYDIECAEVACHALRRLGLET